MGKLHRIRRAWARLSPEARAEIVNAWGRGYPCGCFVDRGDSVRFGQYVQAHKRYVAKLIAGTLTG